MTGVFCLWALGCFLASPSITFAATGSDPDAFSDRTGNLERLPFATLSDFEKAVEDVPLRNGTDAFWKEVLSLRQMPLVFGDTAVFLYRGNARSVGWLGDFNTWKTNTALEGSRVRGTDIWIARKTFPQDARLDYKVSVDGRQLLDPLNPLTQKGIYGRNSVLTMPQFISSEWTVPAKGVTKGHLSQPTELQSKNLGYAKRFQVYTPPGYERLRNLPVIYVTDGEEFSNTEMGALPIILDNLIAEGSIPPIMAVFVDPRTVDTGENRRGPELLTNPRFQWFLTQELIPWIDGRYRTRPVAEARAILGMSLGGLHATYTAVRQSEWFGMAGVLSPYFAAKPAVLTEVEKGARVPVRFFVSEGTYDLDVSNARKLLEILRAKGYDFQYQESNDGHSWGNWRGVLDDMLVYFFGEDAQASAQVLTSRHSRL